MRGSPRPTFEYKRMIFLSGFNVELTPQKYFDNPRALHRTIEFFQSNVNVLMELGSFVHNVIVTLEQGLSLLVPVTFTRSTSQIT
ncbi:hypothetical protein QTP86_000425 [Hemibagrus guttatus]|nr:hypothetical protein QTP86_000425 [Hemibagrus guttatus]